MEEEEEEEEEEEGLPRPRSLRVFLMPSSTFSPWKVFQSLLVMKRSFVFGWVGGWVSGWVGG